MLPRERRHDGDTLAALQAERSSDAVGAFKPSPKAYALVEQNLGVRPAEVAFISSNPFDASGAKSFGFKVAWIERVTAAAPDSALVAASTGARAALAASPNAPNEDLSASRLISAAAALIRAMASST